MKNTKVLLTVLAIILVIAIVVGVILINGGGSKTNLEVSNVEDMKNLVTKLYSGLEEQLPGSLATTEVDLSNLDIVKGYTGLESIEGIKGIVASEPMISSQAYSLVMVQAENSKKAAEIAKAMSEKVNPSKWICVTAENIYATSSGDIAFLVMSSEEWAKPVYENFKKEAGNIGEEYFKQESL